MAKAPAQQAKQIEQEVNSILRKFDLSRVDSQQRENLLALRQDLAHVRSYVNAYELSEVRDEQLDNSKRSRSWLAKANRKILRASQDNIFGPADVAQLSAEIDQLKAELK